MNILYIDIYRKKITAQATLGEMYTSDDDMEKRFCYTLEDTLRPDGLKVPKETAIPAGTYLVSITKSTRFKRDMPLIYNDDAMRVNKGRVMFAGVRFHGGNTHEDTAGCPLIAYKRIDDQTIQGSAEKDFTALLRKYDIGVLNIWNP